MKGRAISVPVLARVNLLDLRVLEVAVGEGGRKADEDGREEAMVETAAAVAVAASSAVLLRNAIVVGTVLFSSLERVCRTRDESQRRRERV